MVENEIEKLKRLRLPKITGTWEEICKTIREFSEKGGLSSLGFLIRFSGVQKPEYYTTYYYTEENIGKLYLHKRNNCFMVPGDCGSIRMSDSSHYKWELIKIPHDCNVDMKRLRNTHNIILDDREQYKFY